MKKIMPFLLILPLLVISLYIGFTQYKNKGIKNITINTPQNEEKIAPIPTNTSQSITPSPKLQNDSQINLIISTPESGATVNANTITIMGSTEPNASISVNDTEIMANKDGSFKTSIALDEGDNYISIVAYNDFGDVAEREIIITRTIAGI